MTEDEFKLFTAGLKAAYPNANFLPDEYSMKLWYKLLQDLGYEEAETASFKHICASKFPPSIAEIRQACQSVKTSDTKSWLEGWNRIRIVMGTYGYNRPREAIAALTDFDPIAGKVASMLGWENLCRSEDQTADRANFRKAYEAIVSREIEDAKMPSMVRDRISALTRKFALQNKAMPSLPSGSP